MSSDKTLLIFDWDDTLFPSTWFSHNSSLEEAVLRTSMEKISASVMQILTEAKRYGDVVIVTNADKGWVESSTNLYMPQCLPILGTIHIISSRSLHEWLYEDMPILWKKLTFQMITVGYQHVISIGDSHAERYALLGLQGIRLKKTLKLEELPTKDTVERQLHMLHAALEPIVSYPENLDIARLHRSQRTDP